MVERSDAESTHVHRSFTARFQDLHPICGRGSETGGHEILSRAARGLTPCPGSRAPLGDGAGRTGRWTGPLPFATGVRGLIRAGELRDEGRGLVAGLSAAVGAMGLFIAIAATMIGLVIVAGDAPTG